MAEGRPAWVGHWGGTGCRSSTACGFACIPWSSSARLGAVSVLGWPEWPPSADRSRAAVGRGVGGLAVVKETLFRVVFE
jgi:hypothetical protein